MFIKIFFLFDLLISTCLCVFDPRCMVDVFANTIQQGTTVSVVKTFTMMPPGGQVEKHTRMFAEVRQIITCVCVFTSKQYTSNCLFVVLRV